MSKVAEDLTVEPIVMDPRIEQRRAEVSRRSPLSRRRVVPGRAKSRAGSRALQGLACTGSEGAWAMRIMIAAFDLGA